MNTANTVERQHRRAFWFWGIVLVRLAMQQWRSTTAHSARRTASSGVRALGMTARARAHVQSSVELSCTRSLSHRMLLFLLQYEVGQAICYTCG
jgi:hypothetical protein